MSVTLPVLLAILAVCHGVKEKPEFSEEIKEIIQHIHNECVGKTGVDEEDIANCEDGIFKEDKKLKCYMFCILEEASLADEDGIVDYDMMISLIPEQYYNRVSKMILGCKHLDTLDKDKCQRAYDVHKCSYEKDPEVGDSNVRALMLDPRGGLLRSLLTDDLTHHCWGTLPHSVSQLWDIIQSW